MYRSYYTYEESEAYKEGRRDEENHRHNYEHDRYSSNPADEAYYQGREDEKREERARQEEREREEYEQQVMMQREEERRREEDEYNQYLQAQMEQQMEDERAYAEMMANENFHPDYYAPEYDVEPPFNELQLDELTPEEVAEINNNVFPITEEQLFMDIQEDERNESVDNS